MRTKRVVLHSPLVKNLAMARHLLKWLLETKLGCAVRYALKHSEPLMLFFCVQPDQVVTALNLPQKSSKLPFLFSQVGRFVNSSRQERSEIMTDLFGTTHMGRVRQTNEDQFLIAELSKSFIVSQTSLPPEDHRHMYSGQSGTLLMVADGMGGAPGGARASRLVVETVASYALNTMHWFFRLHGDEESDLVEELRAALTACQKAIGVAAAAQPEFHQMGTTLTMAYVRWPRAYVIHVGDSRAYLYRDSRLRQITRDQTVAQRMVDEGELATEEAESSRWAHILSSCLSARPDSLEANVFRIELRVGDTLLLCSDGLAKPVTADVIASHMADISNVGARMIAERLVDEANAVGGRDNITVVIANFRAAMTP